MSRRMLIGLLVPMLIICSFGNGVLPLLPLYALKIGASTAAAGWFTAFTFLCLAAGALLAGRSGGLLQRRTFLVLLILLNIPSIVLMGRVITVWQLTALVGFSWLSGGWFLTVINIIASRHAAETERGRVFGLIGVAISAGSIIGGLGIGSLVDRWGYPLMFVVIAACYLLIPPALMLLPRVPVERIKAAAVSGRSDLPAPRIGSAALLVLAAQLIASTANGSGNLGRSLLMNAQEFSAAAITSTLVVGALVTLPVPFVLGWLSDRIGRRTVLIACCACGAGSLALLIASRALWHFWIVGMLLAVLGVSMSIGPAFIADLVHPARVGTAMSLFLAAFYLGSVAGMSVLVPVARVLGMPWTLALGAGVAALGVVLLMWVRRPRAAAQATAAVTPP
ncbi:MAG: MFS transporter [Spirochaetes bacterium]|nr:MFS transporter [Spirochaetota bacterium]